MPESLSPVNSIYVRSQKLVANDRADDDQFGHSVAISGNTAIGVPLDDIGTKADQGSAYIYARNGETWTLQQKLTASDGAIGDNFGFSLDIDGDTGVIGAPRDNINGLESSGSAYVFTRRDSTWKEQPKLINDTDDYPGDTSSGDIFGYSVAIDGNRIIIGAPDDHTENDNLSLRKGSASIYEGSGKSWLPLTKIKGTELRSQFGASVGISGDRVIIGAPQHFLESLSSSRGAAFIYTPILKQQLQVDTGIHTQGFGSSVAIDGDNAVVGSRIGQAYVSKFESLGWTDPEQLTSGGSGFDFGKSVSLDGDLLVVGRPAQGGDRGSAYVFGRINNDWTEKAQLFQKDVPPTGTGDWFGISVAVDGNRIIGGASGEAGGPSRPKNGAASIFFNVSPRPFDFNGGGVSDISVFRPSDSFWYSTDPITRGFSATQWGASGDKIVPADYDGDGKTDIAVFHPLNGFWYILNSSTGFSAVQWGQTGDVPMPNDFDNDGKADVAIFRPSTSTWWWINSSNQQANGVQFGQSGDIPLMADFDGDARGELAVFRPASGTFTWFNLTTSQTGTKSFGLSTDIPTPGDFDGDSKTDIAVFRPSSGEWFRVNSSNSQFVVRGWGTTGDVPTVADFDGDGESDIAVFRPTDGVWYIINSSFNDSYPLPPEYTFITWGASGDVPVPAAYLPY